MFNPTKAHEREIQDGQNRIRMGSRVPDNAVSLAYAYSPPLRPEENVQITDLSGFILENVTNEESAVELWPNDQGLLTVWNGESYVYSQGFTLTNQFKDDVALYYLYKLSHPVHDTRRARGYVNNQVTLVDAGGKPLNEDYVYKLIYVPTDEPNLYTIHIFTNFQKQPNESIRVIYTARKDGRTIPAYSEEIDPQPAFERSADLEKVVRVPHNNYHYYQADGKDVGQSQLYVGSVPLRDLDYRVPFAFRYQVTGKATVKGTTHTIVTPWIYDSLFHKNGICEADEYYRNGYKMLRGLTAREILAEFGDIKPFFQADARVEVTVLSSKEEVEIYTQPDGMNNILATTSVVSRSMPLPDTYRKQYRVKKFFFDLAVRLNDGATNISRHSIHIGEGHKKIAGPFVGQKITIGLLRPNDPVTIYVKDNSVYAYTHEADVFYVEKYGLLTNNSRQIQVLKPSETHSEENWYLRVKNGQFKRHYTTPEGVDVEYFYNVPEYYKQDFDTEYEMPYRKVLDERPEIIGERKIRLRHTPLYMKQDKDKKTYNMEVFVNGFEVSIRGWDAKEGIVEVDMKLKEQDEVVVNYFYEELSYTYRGYWDEENQIFWHLDLNPGIGHTYTYRDAHNQEVVENQTFQLLNRTIYLYMRPSAQFSASGEMVRNSYQSHVLFHTFEELDERNVVLLAKIQVRPNSSSDSIRLLDTRKRGGGVKEHIKPDAMHVIEPESKHYWDIGYWDGEPYSENGVFIVRIPLYLLREHGGTFTREDVELIVQRHVGYGNLPVIEYIDEPKRLLDIPTGVEAHLMEEE